MALALSDFKKTSRTTELGRQLYPHQLRDGRYLAAISYAINYYEQMLGRRRGEFESATLLEFFGDPRLARGLVACLGRNYRWHQRNIIDVVDTAAWEKLQAANLTTPTALRASVYRHVNQHCDGFIAPQERLNLFETLAEPLGLTASQFDLLLNLDDENEAILSRSGPIPAAADVVALYNFHSLETALRNTKAITLQLGGEIWPLLLSVRNLARRYGLDYDIVEGPSDLFGRQMIVTWHGRKDAFGTWSRHGRRVVRALLRLLGAHPDCALSGVAHVVLQSKTFIVKLGPKELAAFGVEARNEGRGDDVWETTLDSALASAWSRAASKGATAEWRLRRDPEPLVLERGVLVPDFIALRGSQRVPVFLPTTQAGAEALVKPLDGLEAAVVVADETMMLAFRGRKIAVAAYQTVPDVQATVAALEAHFPATLAHQPLDRWHQLSQRLAAQGFIAEAELPALLGCGSINEAIQTLRGWRSDDVQLVPGLGLCTREKVRELGALLNQPAA